MAEDIKNVAEDMGWDTGLSAEAKEVNLPPEGVYGFSVIEFERTFAKSSGRPMAKLTLQLDREAQFWKVSDNLVLSASAEWKLISFFECVGLKKKGESLAHMPWDKVLGSTGHVQIKHETYEGKTRCKVDRYIMAEAAKAPTAPSAAITAPTPVSSEQGNLPFEV